MPDGIDDLFDVHGTVGVVRDGLGVDAADGGDAAVPVDVDLGVVVEDDLAALGVAAPHGIVPEGSAEAVLKRSQASRHAEAKRRHGWRTVADAEHRWWSLLLLRVGILLLLFALQSFRLFNLCVPLVLR